MADENSNTANEMHLRAFNMLNTLYNHPEKGTAFKKLVKEVDKNIQIPEIDIAEQIQKQADEKIAAMEAQHKKMQEEWEAEKKAREEEKETNSVRKTLEQVQKEWGFTDEGLQKVVARMKDKNNPDAEAAAAWVASKEPKPAPAQNTGYSPEVAGVWSTVSVEEDYKELHRDPEKWFDKTAAAILDGKIDISQDAA